MSRYPALFAVAYLLKFISVLLILFGVGVSLWYLLTMGPDLTSRILAIAGILCSMTVGVVVYALSDVIHCVMDIEANTRPKGQTQQS